MDENIKTIIKLQYYLELETAHAELRILVAVLLDSATLDWDKKSLSIGSKAASAVLKAISPEAYEATLERLQVAENDCHDN